jgi:hypothetical protein
VTEPYPETRAEVERVIEHAIGEADAEPDFERAFRQAEWLSQTLSRASERAADLRGKIVRRYNEQGIPLAELGRRVALSRARMGQISQKGKE